jgi:hypothetical protein
LGKIAVYITFSRNNSYSFKYRWKHKRILYKKVTEFCILLCSFGGGFPFGSEFYGGSPAPFFEPFPFPGGFDTYQGL